MQKFKDFFSVLKMSLSAPSRGPSVSKQRLCRKDCGTARSEGSYTASGSACNNLHIAQRLTQYFKLHHASAVDAKCQSCFSSRDKLPVCRLTCLFSVWRQEKLKEQSQTVCIFLMYTESMKILGNAMLVSFVIPP